MGNLVKKMPMAGKKGDTIHIPKPVRGDVSQKVEATAVTIQANTASELVVNIDQHWEYSMLIEDITDVQALSSMRRFYTDDAGYALARKVDSDLFALGTGLGDGGAFVIANTPTDWVHSACFYNDAGTTFSPYAEDTLVAADVFSDSAFRAMCEQLDEQDNPMDNRNWVVCPNLKKQLLAIDRYVSTDFVNDKPVSSGYVGNVYGVDIYVSTNVPIIETTAQNLAGGQVRGNIMFHKDAFVFAEQVGVRTQTQYKQEYLADLFTADTLYGLQVYRPEGGVVLATSDDS